MPIAVLCMPFMPLIAQLILERSVQLVNRLAMGVKQAARISHSIAHALHCALQKQMCKAELQHEI